MITSGIKWVHETSKNIIHSCCEKISDWVESEERKMNLKINILENNNLVIATPNGKEVKKATIKFNKNEITIGGNDGINILSVEDQQEVEYQRKQIELTKEE